MSYISIANNNLMKKDLRSFYKQTIVPSLINDFGYTLKDLHNFLSELKYEPLKTWKNDKAYHYIG